MKSTFTQGFSYPEANDFGNGALALQLLAEQFDTKMFAIQQGMNNELRPPTVAMTSPSNFGPISSGVNTDISTMFSSIVYNNGFVNPISNGVIAPGAGSYMFGVLANVQCTGTITSNTLRDLSINFFVPTGPTLSSVYNKIISDTANESGIAGGMWLNAVGVGEVPLIPLNPPQRIRVRFYHTNTGSTMNVMSGAVLWCTKIANLVN